MITTAIALVLRIVSNPLGNVFQKKLTGDGNHPLLVNFLTFFLLGMLCIIPACQADWTSVPWAGWLY